MPRSSNGTATAWWRSVGTATVTASTRPCSAAASVSGLTPVSDATRDATSGLASTIATSRTPDDADRIRA